MQTSPTHKGSRNVCALIPWRTRSNHLLLDVFQFAALLSFLMADLTATNAGFLREIAWLLIRHAVLFRNHVRGNTRRLVNGRQSAAGMCASTYQVHILNLFEPVVREEAKHLRERVREIEGCAQIDIRLLLPIERCHHSLGDDVRLNICLLYTSDAADDLLC